MRYHELALQKWLNRVFKLRYGCPIPVIFASPMDAFSEFTKLWADADNPYAYLSEAKDDKGTPLYLPYPSPVRYPLLSVFRRNYKLRNSHNFSIHRMRHINWPTVADDAPPTYGKDQQGAGLNLGDLGNVTVSRYPMAFDYRFQLDFFCNRPDTQAFFLTQLFREFWRTGGPQMQTWVVVAYPLLGNKLVRVYIDGEVENMTPEVPEDGKNVEFRVSFAVVMEGYDIDLQYKIHPALWTLVLSDTAALPDVLDNAMQLAADEDYSQRYDLRGDPTQNPTVAYRIATTAMPATGTYWPDTNSP